MSLAFAALEQPLIVLFFALTLYLIASAISLTFIYLSSAAFGYSFKASGIVLAIGVPFALLGVSAGYITGLSRESAVGAVLPAVLTLFGGLALTLSSDGGRKALVACSAIVYLSVSLLGGVEYGSRVRTLAEASSVSFDALMDAANLESTINRYRKKIGLAPMNSKGEPDPKADR